MTTLESRRHLLLWDGDCGFCSNAVKWIRNHDHSNTFTIIPYQKCASPPMTPELKLACSRAVHVITNEGRILSGAEAVFFTLQSIDKWKWAAQVASHRPFIYAAEIAYRIVARNRNTFSRFFFRGHEGGCE